MYFGSWFSLMICPSWKPWYFKGFYYSQKNCKGEGSPLCIFLNKPQDLIQRKQWPAMTKLHRTSQRWRLDWNSLNMLTSSIINKAFPIVCLPSNSRHPKTHSFPTGLPCPGGAFPNMASVPRFVGTAVWRSCPIAIREATRGEVELETWWIIMIKWLDN